MIGVHHPIPGSHQKLAYTDVWDFSHYSDQFLFAFDFHFKHGKAGLLRMEGDALYMATDFRKFRFRHDRLKEKEVYLGDIIINLSEIKSKKEIKKFLIEFDRLWIHGLVHLFGYEHERDKDYLKMNRVEKNYFNLINA